MDTSLDDHPLAPEVILKLIKDALSGCRKSPDRLCGFARGLEIGISTLQGPRSTACSMDYLQERSFGLSVSRDDYHLGVSLGINLATKIASAMHTRAQATA